MIENKKEGKRYESPKLATFEFGVKDVIATSTQSLSDGDNGIKFGTLTVGFEQ